jgi:hypothetical protein
MMPSEALIVEKIKQTIGDPKGKCYSASEALYHLLGGKDAGYKPVRGGGHWWLVRSDGSILDVTAEQYPEGFNYSCGKGGGFLTVKLSKKAQEITNGYNSRQP